MPVKIYEPVNNKVKALQIVLGTTTKREILDFCPGANVGTPGATEEESLDSADLRWLYLSNGLEEVYDSDYIVKDSDGFYVRPAVEFEKTYREITG